MANFDYRTIEKIIGYKFSNRNLLRQAFTRKSYSEENRDSKNNEALEFVGDKIVDIVVVKAFTEKFGSIDESGEWGVVFSEGDLTKLKSRLVESKSLARHIDVLGLNGYLIMSRGDIKQGVNNDVHVKEDLFEAIVGAVAIDSDWDRDVLRSFVWRMLALDDFFAELAAKEGNTGVQQSYVDILQHWWQLRYSDVPPYMFLNSVERTIGEDDRKTVWGGSGFNSCRLLFDGLIFIGRGANNVDAREICARLVCEYLDERGELYTQEILLDKDSISLENAVNKLQELAQKKFIAFPEYDFAKSGADNCPVWECICTVNDIGYVRLASTTKAEAKKRAAFDMLKRIIKNSR